MGKKKTGEPAPEEKKKVEEAKEEAKPKEDEEKEPDPPIVVELKEIDDKYLALEREYEKQMQELQRKYTKLQEPLLDQRAKMLADEAGFDGPKTGTPAMPGFWLKAMQNHPALSEQIEEWDEPVLQFVTDIKKLMIDDADHDKGFKLEFYFAENPYFENKVLTKEYYTSEMSPYTGDIEVEEVKITPIEWKPGKNVTVSMVQKKVKGGGAKKAKQKGAKEEPRDSLFRHFFRPLKKGMPLPDDVNLDDMEEESEQDDDEMVEMLMDNDHEVGCAIRDQLVPFAVRWFTGEAAPDEDDDDDEDDEEEDDDDEDDDDDDEDDEDEEDEPPKGKKGGKAAPKKKAQGDGDAKKQEECKQQ
eukprot:gnl/TRDRNA2_/TRDRNA2_181618_c0_seq1.p1 gnl/TRDRNA2_/TRDRNA2_181618_c0~~gnl/TRDRNA2_/TRDRNA2_181618_c0_seq1.p1  ORF type:complete len:357 (+),score=163.82 gnl/TRDRNA2_/TRDRNA2_181618_c0_seq1:97-1167(+)